MTLNKVKLKENNFYWWQLGLEILEFLNILEILKTLYKTNIFIFHNECSFNYHVTTKVCKIFYYRY